MTATVKDKKIKTTSKPKLTTVAAGTNKMPPLGKGQYEMLNLVSSKIRVIPGFNPRESLGDLSCLEKSIREHGIQMPIAVRPSKKEGMYDLIAGNRRFTAGTKVGLKTFPVVVREDLSSDADALAFALSENAEDSRTNLTPLEQGKAFQKLMAADKKLTTGLVAKICGCSDQHVRRMIRIVGSPKEVISKLEKGEIKAGAAAAIAEMNPKIQKKVIDGLQSGMTEAEVRKLGNQVARDENVDAKKNKAKRSPEKAVSTKSEMVVTRSKTEMRNAGDNLVCEILDVEEAGGKSDKLRYALASIFFYFNKVDKISIDTPSFKKAFDEIAKAAVKVDGEELEKKSKK